MASLFMLPSFPTQLRRVVFVSTRQTKSNNSNRIVRMSLQLLEESIQIVENESRRLQPPKPFDASKAVKARNKTTEGGVRKTQLLTKKTKITKNDKTLEDLKAEIGAKDKKITENVRRLLALSQNTIKAADATKIVKRAHKGRYVEPKLPKVEPESIFTDEDFRAFEEEYFNS